MDNKVYKAVNWDRLDNEWVMTFWEQGIKQFWVDTEYTPSRDVSVFRTLDPKMQDTYIKVLGGLTLLDTLQSHTGMPSLIPHVDSLQCRSVLSFMCMMESIHAKSYSTIFTTIASREEIDDVFDWVQSNKYLQLKASKIDHYYGKVAEPNPTPRDVYMALASSIMLESFLFYSGFFLPLYLSGHGKMVGSGDIIKKIVADESIHGIFTGMLAQTILAQLPKDEQSDILDEVHRLFKELESNEIEYTKSIYSEVGLVPDVLEYLKYNANKAFSNLGLDNPYDHVDINPIVENSLNLETTQHDFFSTKSTNYELASDNSSLSSDELAGLFND